MMGIKPSQNLTANAVVLSTSGGNTSMLLRDLLRSQRLNIFASGDQLEPLLVTIEKSNIKIIVIDDSKEQPASLLVRRLMKSPICLGTPTLCLTDKEIKGDLNFLANLEHTTIAPKPLTPDQFFPALKSIITKWDNGYHQLVRQATLQIQRGNHETGLRMLTKLNEHKSARPVVAPILAHFYKLTGHPQTSEKILLSALKEHPRVVSLIMALSDLYMCTAMPMMAYRLLVGARAALGSSTPILLDLVQACVMLNNLDEGLAYLVELQSSGVEPTKIPAQIVRLLYAEGRQEQIEKYIQRFSLAQKFEDAWTLENSSNTQLKAS